MQGGKGMSENKKPLEVVHPDGRIEIFETIMTFELTDLKKEFILYTDNKVDKDGIVHIYGSEIRYPPGSDIPDLLGMDNSDLTTYYRIRDIISRLSNNGKGIVNRPNF